MHPIRIIMALVLGALFGSAMIEPATGLAYSLLLPNARLIAMAGVPTFIGIVSILIILLAFPVEKPRRPTSKPNRPPHPPS